MWDKEPHLIASPAVKKDTMLGTAHDNKEKEELEQRPILLISIQRKTRHTKEVKRKVAEWP
jgi:hypothetical protein